jgi:glycosyltransferase involved in cell wall biosynthesis
MKPLVSIIIPAYNCELFFAETINSALGQTWGNKEIIIVDDGSTDNTLSIAKRFEKEHAIIKVYSQQNKGACAARNLGYRMSNGNYIQYLDGDDILDKYKIERQVILAETNPDCIISCNWIKFHDNLDNNIGGLGPYTTVRKDMLPLDFLLENRMMACHAWLTPRNLINMTGNWDETLTCNQDGEFFYRVVGNSNKVLFCDKTIVYYRAPLGHNGVSALSSYDKYSSLLKVALSYKKIVLSLGGRSLVSQKAIGDYFQRLHYNIYFPNYPDLIERCREQEEYSYGNIEPELTGFTKMLSFLTGWKIAKRLQNRFKKINHFDSTFFSYPTSIIAQTAKVENNKKI